MRNGGTIANSDNVPDNLCFGAIPIKIISFLFEMESYYQRIISFLLASTINQSLQHNTGHKKLLNIPRA